MYIRDCSVFVFITRFPFQIPVPCGIWKCLVAVCTRAPVFLSLKLFLFILAHKDPKCAPLPHYLILYSDSSIKGIQWSGFFWMSNWAFAWIDTAVLVAFSKFFLPGCAGGCWSSVGGYHPGFPVALIACSFSSWVEEQPGIHLKCVLGVLC